MTLSLWLLPKVPQSARGSRIYATSHSVMNRRGLRLANFYDPIELSDSSTLCLAIGNLSWAGISYMDLFRAWWRPGSDEPGSPVTASGPTRFGCSSGSSPTISAISCAGPSRRWPFGADR